MQWKESQGTFSTCGYPHHSTPETQPSLAVGWWEFQLKSPVSERECWGQGASSSPKLWPRIYQKLLPVRTEALNTQAPLPEHTRDALYSLPTGPSLTRKVKAMSTGWWAVARKVLMATALPLSQPRAWWGRRWWAVLPGSSAGGAPLPHCSSLYRSNSDPHWLLQSGRDFYIYQNESTAGLSI